MEGSAVYVLEVGAYEAREVMGVYATLEAAMAASPIPDQKSKRRLDAEWYAKQRGEEPPPRPAWREVRPGEWDNGIDEVMGIDNGHSADITRWEVRS